jgi:hypothetical protein
MPTDDKSKTEALERMALVVQRLHSTLQYRIKKAMDRPRSKLGSIAAHIDDVDYLLVLIDHEQAKLHYGRTELEEASFEISSLYLKLHSLVMHRRLSEEEKQLSAEALRGKDQPTAPNLPSEEAEEIDALVEAPVTSEERRVFFHREDQLRAFAQKLREIFQLEIPVRMTVNYHEVANPAEMANICRMFDRPLPTKIDTDLRRQRILFINEAGFAMSLKFTDEHARMSSSDIARDFNFLKQLPSVPKLAPEQCQHLKVRFRKLFGLLHKDPELRVQGMIYVQTPEGVREALCDGQHTLTWVEYDPASKVLVLGTDAGFRIGLRPTEKLASRSDEDLIRLFEFLPHKRTRNSKKSRKNRPKAQ